MTTQASSLQLQGITELTLLAPLKCGFVPSADTCGYATRLRMLFATLSATRSLAREQAAASPLFDTVARVQTILGFRLAILEPTQQLLLAVTFDSAWEPYIRKVWRDLGALLDVIFCHCEGYPIARDSSFETYVAWIRTHQVQAGFFYVASGLSAGDLRYLVDLERLQREGDAAQKPPLSADQAIARLHIPSPQEGAHALAALGPRRALELGLQALSSLYALTDYFAQTPQAGVRDHIYLLRAAQDLLADLNESPLREALAAAPDLRAQYQVELAWFLQAPPSSLLAPLPERPLALQNLQAGLLQPEQAHSHGLLLLLSVRDAALARAFVGRLLPRLSAASASDGRTQVNLGLSPQGLMHLGVDAETLARFPREFREGMEARAGLLGDFRGNHPVNWRRPLRHGFEGGPDSPLARVSLAEVDVVLQFRVQAPHQGQDHLLKRGHPLWDEFQSVLNEPGLQLLAVETLLRGPTQQGRMIEHFGFADGISQPSLDAEPGRYWSDRVGPGEFLLGHGNARGDGPGVERDDPLLADGSFLVIRKLRQYVGRLEQRLRSEAQRLGDEHGIELSAEQIKAAMMGRRPCGTPLAADAQAPSLNDFNYDADPGATRCPFQAHVRRANPRTGRAPVPRLLRRGMSYGPARGEEVPGQPEPERGLFFMAYNASISEQYEVVQRWINGGNASGVFSGQADPLLGVPSSGDSRCFRFQHEGQILRVMLDDAGSSHPEPFVELAWGLYLFVPSLSALQRLTQVQAVVTVSPAARQGEALIQQLQGPMKALGASAWKAALEDMGARTVGASDAIWAAVRELHDGALDTGTAYGILVGSPALVDEVFLNTAGRYSVCGYLERMRQSIGPIFLGLDAGAAYDREAEAVNAQIRSISEEQAYALTRRIARECLQSLWQVGQRPQSGTAEAVPLDLLRFSDAVLADLSRAWFDIPDGVHVGDAPRVWDWALTRPGVPPRCPGHFTTPSRYFFQPLPEGTAAEEQGQRHGRELHAAVLGFVREVRAGRRTLHGSLSRPLFGLPMADAQLASTLIGVMMGFLPTVDGCFRRSVIDGRADMGLWQAQAAYQQVGCPETLELARACVGPWLTRAMQRHPVPDVVWRTATVDHRLGPVDRVSAGRRVVVGIMSATQALQAAGSDSVLPVFGGDRSQPHHPQHACPGYAAAMGVLLGMVAELLSWRLAPGLLPQGLVLLGR